MALKDIPLAKKNSAMASSASFLRCTLNISTTTTLLLAFLLEVEIDLLQPSGGSTTLLSLISFNPESWFFKNRTSLLYLYSAPYGSHVKFGNFISFFQWAGATLYSIPWNGQKMMVNSGVAAFKCVITEFALPFL